MSHLPRTTRLRLEPTGPVLTAWLDDAATRNALSLAMRDDLLALLGMLEKPSGFRALVLRGANGTFCSGGDLKAFTAATQGSADLAADNRMFGQLLTRFNALPLTTFALVEGAAYAGALGLLCTTDVVIVLDGARFAVSETSLGLVPAQIAPFMVQRIGLTQARRLALTGARFDGAEAARLGFAQFRAADLTEGGGVAGQASRRHAALRARCDGGHQTPADPVGGAASLHPVGRGGRRVRVSLARGGRPGRPGCLCGKNARRAGAP